MFLLDTNVVSAARKRQPAVTKWLADRERGDLSLSVVTLGEIARGIHMKQRHDPTTANHLAVWLQMLRHDYGNRILGIDERIAIEWGRIAALRTRGVPDGLIAATAAVHGLTIVTRNVADFEDTGLAIVNPWAD
ncbi:MULTISPECIES: type II toxin-antitoxin system VapC family toxin [Phyllobacteriaceae]|jgi:toxin FitB|uniref:Ribonuclease VapC n=1 Tax=Mesorhizobium hungaricum TaxID=1566387 RepID=A0A1C2DEW5_9HYPH|nr:MULTISPECIES: type II toxin-antitoxin system VapC family toxin [Mesorhizobium]MBN9232561.1 type II toxin-antitoxin system VapC family toxin [Mesorhizobium sp.]MDQ0330158.1 putative nucleic acid-binding protein [Mesorhizobium sp. YL-MeA3-2017]OCX13311.1 plasmid stabilization protein [Mesorhizobium hungaricum]